MRIVVVLLTVLLVAPGLAEASEDDETYVKVGGRKARLIACFKEVQVPDLFKVKHVLVSPPRQEYIKRRWSGRVELVEHPAIYVEERTLVEPAHIELREVPCD